MITLSALLLAASGVTLAPVEFKSWPKLKGWTEEQTKASIRKDLEKLLPSVTFQAGDGAVFVKVTAHRQKNKPNSEIMAHPSSLGSWTEVDLDFRYPGEELRKLKGRAEGSYFGTTTLWEMTGQPEDKAAAIGMVAIQRSKAYAAAIANALKPVLPAQ